MRSGKHVSRLDKTQNTHSWAEYYPVQLPGKQRAILELIYTAVKLGLVVDQSWTGHLNWEQPIPKNSPTIWLILSIGKLSIIYWAKHNTESTALTHTGTSVSTKIWIKFIFEFFWIHGIPLIGGGRPKRFTSIDWKSDWLANWMNDWLNEWQIDLLTDWCKDWLIDWLTSHETIMHVDLLEHLHINKISIQLMSTSS